MYSYGLAAFLPLFFVHLPTSTASFLPRSVNDGDVLAVKGANTSPSTISQQSSPSNASLSANAQSTSISIPIDDDLNLDIISLGDQIPVDIFEHYLHRASESVRTDLEHDASKPIKHNSWTYGQLPELEIIVRANPDKTVTYSQLASILDGLGNFLTGRDHGGPRNLVFDISVNSGETIGLGFVWHGSLGQGQASNTTTSSIKPALFSPNLSNSSNATLAHNGNTWVPVPFTSMHLLFNFFGDPIPPSDFEQAFSAVNLKIIDWIGRYPHLPVTKNRFDYDESDTHISVIGNRGLRITWLQLFQILQALCAFVTSEPTHYQILHYEIYLQPGEQLGIGLLWYYPPGQTIA